MGNKQYHKNYITHTEESYMKKTLFLVALTAMIFATAFSSPASATMTSVGAPNIIGSWSQGFIENNVGLFTNIEATMETPGVSFESPGFVNFTDPNWSTQTIQPNYISAAGNAIDSLQFNMNFTSDVSTPFSFIFTAWNNSAVADSVEAAWDGSNWSINPAAPVPIPAAAMLFAPGLACLAFMRRRILGS
jgi:hypothetical protein